MQKPCLLRIYLNEYLSFSNVFHVMCVWPTALKLVSITNFNMLFLVTGSVRFVKKIYRIYANWHDYVTKNKVNLC